MKKLFAFLACVITCLPILTSCGSLKHEHIPGEWQSVEEVHWRVVDCSWDMCDIDIAETPHSDEDENGICDVCGHKAQFIFKLTADGAGYELDTVGPGYKGGDVTVPSNHEGLPVVEIGYDAFESEYKLTSVVIPDSITLISDDAFENQTSLSSINVGKNVVTIGVSAFEGCTSLKTVVIGDATQYIYASAFEGCTALESITLGNNVKEITGSVFENCTSLKTITIPASIEKMGAWVFYGNNMTDITFGVSAPSENWNEKWSEGLNEDVTFLWSEAK